MSSTLKKGHITAFNHPIDTKSEVQISNLRLNTILGHPNLEALPCFPQFSTHCMNLSRKGAIYCILRLTKALLLRCHGKFQPPESADCRGKKLH